MQVQYSPAGAILEQITSPILRPFRRVIPLISGFDLSPIPALIFLQLLLILFINPLYANSIELAYGSLGLG